MRMMIKITQSHSPRHATYINRPNRWTRASSEND